MSEVLSSVLEDKGDTNAGSSALGTVALGTGGGRFQIGEL